MSIRLSIPYVNLTNNLKIPVIGLGTWRSKPAKITKVVETAIDEGYRHFDCALIYKNEAAIGKGIHNKIAENVITRKDVFISGKLWNTFHRPDLVKEGICRSLNDLKIDYFDLYLMHWPMGYKECAQLTPRHGNRILYSLVHYLDTWEAMQELVDIGWTRAIGVSNFNKRQISFLLKNSSVKPVANQIECHPYLNQEELVSFCQSKGIHIICYSPLGSPDRPWAKLEEPVLLQDETLKEIGKFYERTPAQIALRYQIERGNIVVPRAELRWQLKENLNIFNFKFYCEHIENIDSLECGKRYFSLKGVADHPFYPFCKEEEETN